MAMTQAFPREDGSTNRNHPAPGTAMHIQTAPQKNALSEPIRTAGAQKPWCVFDRFDFLMHVIAKDVAEARQAAASETGLTKQLTVFMENDTVTTYAARNTFRLFQNHGGLSMTRNSTSRQIDPISRDDFASLVRRMMVWVDTPLAAKYAASVKSDLGYVRALIDEFNQILNSPRWAYKTWISIELDGYDNRQFDTDSERADEYCHRLHSSSPEQ